jgi:hypothetical protein
MHVVKLTHARESALEHLDVRLRRDSLEVFRSHAPDEAVHERAPAPEVVRRGSAEFRETGHSTLETVAVYVAHAGQRHLDALLAGLHLRAGKNPAEAPVGDLDPHVPGPPFRQQRRSKEQRRRRSQI